MLYIVTRANVIDAHLDQVTSANLAVDCQIENISARWDSEIFNRTRIDQISFGSKRLFLADEQSLYSKIHNLC